MIDNSLTFHVRTTQTFPIAAEIVGIMFIICLMIQ